MTLNKLDMLDEDRNLVKKIDGKNFTAAYASNKKGELKKMAERYREVGYLARIKDGKSSFGPGWEILFIRKG
jgi:hypothetical protein